MFLKKDGLENIVLHPEMPCPCESGRVVEKCCWRGGILRPKQVKTKLSRPKTGYSHPGCYASALADCSRKLTREHYISEGILEILHSWAGITVRGFHWLKDQEKKTTPRQLASKVLCDRHNEALSGLDTVAIRFFKSLEHITRDPKEGVKHDQIFLFNGHDIERWMLKVLCGLVYSENATVARMVIKGWKPDIRWLRILFGQATFPRKWGMYLPREPGLTVGSRRIELAPLVHPDYEIYGLHIMLIGCQFVLMMINPTRIGLPVPTDDAIHRPTHIVKDTRFGQKVVLFRWDIPGDNRYAITSSSLR